MIVPVMAISNLVLTWQIYSEETNGAHKHNRDHVPLSQKSNDHKPDSWINELTVRTGLFVIQTKCLGYWDDNNWKGLKFHLSEANEMPGLLIK